MAITAQKAGRLGLQMTGFKQVMAALAPGGEVARRVETAATRAMIENGEDLLNRSGRLAPVKEATLRGSGSCLVAVRGKTVSRRRAPTPPAGAPAPPPMRTLVEAGTAHDITAEVTFDTSYAQKQHDHTEYSHPKGGQALYLITPLEERAQLYARNLADAVGEAIV